MAALLQPKEQKEAGTTKERE